MENSESQLKAKVHSSWLLCAVACGVLLSMFAVVHTSFIADLTYLWAGLLLLLIAFKNKRALGVVCAVVAGMCFGAWRAGSFLDAQSVFTNFIGSQVSVVGKVSTDPSLSVSGDTRIRVKLTSLQGVPVEQSPEVWVSISQSAPALKRSDIVQINGVLDAGFGTFSSVMYRADIQKVERQGYGDVARDVRDSFASAVRLGIEEPEASLAVGFLLGQKAELPEKLQNELRLLGLTHIVVASGYNLTVLVRFSKRLFMRVSRFTALAASLLLIFGFTQMTGFTPSMSRASLIAFLSLIAWYFGRKIHPFVLIPCAAALTLLVSPAYAQGDIGWMLSFSSFIGVIILAPLIHAYFFGESRPKPFRQIVVETLSAQILTLPIILYVFGVFSPLSLPANILIVPLIPFVMGLSFFSGLVGLSLPFLASAAGLPAELLLRYMTATVEWLSARPLASNTLTISAEVVMALYAIILCVAVYMWRRTRFDFHSVNIIE